MNGTLGKLGKLAAVAAATTAVVTLAGSPASAASAAYNTRSVWLDGIPRASDADACVTRTIALASGTYTWTQIFGTSRTPTRTIYLAADTYTWRDCIRAYDGYYKQTSTLLKPGEGAAYLNDPNPLHLSAGTYNFGSMLDPHF
ncbi:hypothetical protein [Streptomyces tritici]|uniref:hypothetical protein n=1 Tax=Streptomyces tritici TaxID=2054410 RepID=UPI003AF1ABE9